MKSFKALLIKINDNNVHREINENNVYYILNKKKQNNESILRETNNQHSG